LIKSLKISLISLQDEGLRVEPMPVWASFGERGGGFGDMLRAEGI